MKSLSHLIFPFLVASLGYHVAIGCPAGCQCLPGADGSGGTTFCMHTSLDSIPSLDNDTEQLYMQGHTLGTIPNRAFITTPNLRKLVLENCGIEALQTGAFAGLQNLVTLNLKGNRIKELRQGMFAGINQINEINLDSNHLHSIDEFTFDGLKNKLLLKFENNNNLKNISPKAFKGAVIKEMYFYNSSLSNESLESILPLHGMLNVFFLSANRLPLTIPHTLFRGFFLLTLKLANNGITDVSFLHHVRADDISLEYNNIGTLNPSEFPSLRQTRILRLSHTMSRGIDGSFFEGMNSLNQLYLSHNDISTVPESMLNVFDKLDRLTLEENPIHCNCEVIWFQTWLALDTHDVVTTPIMCATPDVVALSELKEDELVCSAPSAVTIKEKAESAIEVTLLCSAEGNPPPSIHWQSPDGLTYSTRPSLDRISLETEGTLQAVPEGGTYTCTASNIAGNLTREIVVTEYINTASSLTGSSWIVLTLLVGIFLHIS